MLESSASRPDSGAAAETVQVVVVCGGRGTRLAPSVGALPKILTPIQDRPLLAHLLDDLSILVDAGRRVEVLLLAGVGGEMVAAEAPGLAPSGVAVETVIESEPLGTAGALHNVASRVQERFIYVCGDILTRLDWARFYSHALDRGGLATLLVHRSNHPEDSDLVILDDADRAVGWSRRGDHQSAWSGALGNAGVSIFHRDVLRYIPKGRPSDVFRDVLPALVDRRAAVHGYRTSEYVRDMGTPSRLDSVREDVVSGRAELKAELALLDRDGVLNQEVDWLHRPDQLCLIPGSGDAVRRFNEAGARVAVVTNQPVIARGMCTPDGMERIHARMSELLAEHGAHIDRYYFCPHHPETHYDEGDPALRGPCRCRKPGTGMLEEALKEALDAFGIPAWRAVMVGDRSTDMQAAANAGLASVGVRTGQGQRDGVSPARPVWTFDDLRTAVDWLCPSTEALR